MNLLANAHALNIGFICFWRIEDFAICKPNKDFVLHSERFKIDMIHCSEWHLEIQQNSSRTLSVYLFKDEGGCCKYNAISYSISLLTNSGWKILVIKSSNVFKSEGGGFGMPHFIKWRHITEENSTYLPKKSLTLSFRIWNACTCEEVAYCLMSSRMINERDLVHLSFQTSSRLEFENNEKVYASNSTQTDKILELPNDIGFKSVNIQTEVYKENPVINNLEDSIFLFKEKGFEYVVLRTGKKEVFAHKGLLCAISPVFEYMFSKDSKECVDNELDIDGIESDTLILMLKFIHSEPLGEIRWEEIVKLFSAANKYEIKQLVSSCVSFLKKKISEKTVCEAFVLADLYQNEDLRHIAQEYFCENSKTILQTSEFQDLLFNRTEMTSEILQKLAERL